MNDTWTPEREIKSLELELEKAEHGMGMPYDAARVQHLRQLLAQARARTERYPGNFLQRPALHCLDTWRHQIQNDVYAGRQDDP